MSQHGLITLDFGDGAYDFRLSLAGIEELEAKTEVSIYLIADKLRMKLARLVEMREVIRIGLIGGGTKPADALALVRRYLDERPLEETRDVALAVVLAGLARIHSDSLKKETADTSDTEGKQSASTLPQ